MRRTHSKEEIRDVHGDIYSQSHICEVEAVGSEDQGQGDNVVGYQFLEVLSRLLETHKQDDHLLRPVCSLREVVGLEDSIVRLVRESLEHASGVEVPDGCPRHDV